MNRKAVAEELRKLVITSRPSYWGGLGKTYREFWALFNDLADQIGSQAIRDDDRTWLSSQLLKARTELKEHGYNVSKADLDKEIPYVPDIFPPEIAEALSKRTHHYKITTVTLSAEQELDVATAEVGVRGSGFFPKQVAPAVCKLIDVAWKHQYGLSTKSGNVRESTWEKATADLRKCELFQDKTILKYAKWFIDPLHSFGRGANGTSCFRVEDKSEMEAKYRRFQHINIGLTTIIESVSYINNLKISHIKNGVRNPEGLTDLLRDFLTANQCHSVSLQNAVVAMVQWKPKAKKTRQIHEAH